MKLLKFIFWSKSINYVRIFDFSLNMISLWFCSLILFLIFFFWKKTLYIPSKIDMYNVMFSDSLKCEYENFCCCKHNKLIGVSLCSYLLCTTGIRIQFIHFPTIWYMYVWNSSFINYNTWNMMWCRCAISKDIFTNRKESIVTSLSSVCACVHPPFWQDGRSWSCE